VIRVNIGKLALLSAPLVLFGLAVGMREMRSSIRQPSSEVLGETATEGEVLGDEGTNLNYRFNVNVPANFAGTTSFE